MQKLPVGIQTFSEIRNKNYIYIDKTQEAYSLITKYKYVFLSRPRRFGKSLFLDTLKEIFEGNKALFKGLYIYDKYDFDDKYPVIKISFNSGSFFTSSGFQETLHQILDKNERDLKVPAHSELNSSGRFKRLIEEVYTKYQKSVVILIDEYDKPILDNIENETERKARKEELKSFYAVIKDSDMYIRFAFLTGVSKFSKVNIFSGLNNIEDISLNSKYGNICGYTHHNIENEFSEYLQGVDFNELKNWYNGYNFLKDKVYNPFDILLFIRNDFEYDNYWFETGTPSFLIKLIKEKNYYLPDINNIIVGKEIMKSFDIDNIKLEVLLYQTGYLTIEKVLPSFDGTQNYKLCIPNKEVKLSFHKEIISNLYDDYGVKNRENLYYSLLEGDLEKFKDSLISLFASIPYNNYAKNNINVYEGFYASVIYVYLASLGLPLHAEEPTNKGRLDLSLEIDNKIYVIEFKMGDENALEQIKEKKYYEKFSNQNKEIYLVGINFSEEEKNISNFEWELPR
ncbi:MAG: hypothetical protein CSB01_00550 [Bacteroidia bacterium]|nr:MAG: hypothetical protein CSB01_00550 [Bacteroidia bacterium]